MGPEDADKSACPRWQRRPADRPREILEAAGQEFAERGFDRATLAEVARRAGVSPGTVAHYFGSKADLFEAVIADQALANLAGDEELLTTNRGTYRELLHVLLTRMWARMQTPGKPELVLTVLSEISSFPHSARLLFRQMIERSRKTIQGVLEAGTRAGEFDLADPEATSQLLAATILGATLDLHFLGRCYTDLPCRDRALPTLLSAVDRIVGPVGSTAT
jgi:AcrR family transcriptional regulator